MFLGFTVFFLKVLSVYNFISKVETMIDDSELLAKQVLGRPVTIQSGAHEKTPDMFVRQIWSIMSLLCIRFGNRSRVGWCREAE